MGKATKAMKDITYESLLEHAKQHESMVKDFNWHKASGGVATAATIDEIKTFRPKYSGGYKGKSSSSKTWQVCTVPPQNECPAWGKKCYKCGNKKPFQYM